jgi:hypothetical protein
MEFIFWLLIWGLKQLIILNLQAGLKSQEKWSFNVDTEFFYISASRCIEVSFAVLFSVYNAIISI